ncbi:MAG TPA: hypothetical protein VFQ61_18335 [Polyangiaceae bacterium]|nr:hypothetical protein [Polyangiaceae bacterium]
MDTRALVQFKRDPAGFVDSGLFRVMPITAHAPPSPGGIAIDSGEKFSLVRYVPADSLRTLRLKATDLAQNAGHDVICQDGVLDGSADVEGYYLGWKTDEIHMMSLSPLCGADFFVTAKMNGCCVYVSGTQASPTVIHANTGSAALEDFDDSGYATMAEKTTALFEYQATIYRKIYAKLAARLAEFGHIQTGGPVTVFDPGNYRLAGGYDARVFGLRRSGNWTFYYSCERSQNGAETHVTRELWPTFEQI